MRGTVRITGTLADRVRALLGGENPTPKRVTDLLDELEQRRVVPGQESLVKPGAEMPREAHAPALAEVDPSELGEGTQLVNAIITGMTAPFPTADAEVPTGWAEERRVLYATLKGLEAKIEELRKPPTAEERDQAIGSGKLPVTTAPAAPLGYTGSAQLPRGTWFLSPFGPRIEMKICGCPECTPFRLQHYFCVMCRTGPYHYQQRYPGGRKMWAAPGSTWGINHECCSVVCWMRYQELIGVVPGVNDHEPPGLPTPEPQRPVVPVGSD